MAKDKKKKRNKLKTFLSLAAIFIACFLIYARGKYMVSKPGEQVFKLPAKNNDDDD